MKYHNTVFNELLKMLPREKFEQDVVREQANRYTNPSFLVITEGKKHEVKVAQELFLPSQ